MSEIDRVVVYGGQFGGRGGVETHITRWCREFVQSGPPVSLVVSASPAATSGLQALERRGVRCIDLGRKGGLSRGLNALLAAIKLRGERTLFYSHGIGKMSLALSCLLRPVRWVHHHHIHYAVGSRQQSPRWRRAALERADHVVLCSPPHVENFLADYPGGNAIFLPYLKSEGSAALAPPPGRPMLGYIGLLRHGKGVAELLAMAPALQKCGIGLSLWGRDAEGVLADGVPPGVAWHGEYDPESDLDQILSQVSCLLLPLQEGEGLPLVISEALSRGVPVVTREFAGVNWLRDLHPGLRIGTSSPASLLEQATQAVELGSSPDLRASLRAAYLSCLSNSKCISWWEGVINHGNRP